MKNPTVYVGTSGWNYKHWRGAFYPREVKQTDWLSYLADRLNTVEINTSFYRFPKPDMIDRWQEQTPHRFRFAVKLWRGITHYKKLRNCKPSLRNFFQIIERLEARRRGPLLVQLPSNQGKDVEKLQDFLDDIKETSSGRWKVAIEFRNPDWLCDEVYATLNRARAAICLHDMAGQAPVNEPNDASFVYVRRHGPGRSHYQGNYGPKALEADARRIRRWAKEGKTVFVYYNNDAQAHAVKNALALGEKLPR